MLWIVKIHAGAGINEGQVSRIGKSLENKQLFASDEHSGSVYWETGGSSVVAAWALDRMLSNFFPAGDLVVIAKVEGERWCEVFDVG